MGLQKLEASPLSHRILLPSGLRPHFHNSACRNSGSHVHAITGNGSQVAVGMSTHLPNALLEILAASSFRLRRYLGSQMLLSLLSGKEVCSQEQALPAPSPVLSPRALSTGICPSQNSAGRQSSDWHPHYENVHLLADESPVYKNNQQ